MSETTKPDLIEKVEELLANENLQWFSTKYERQMAGLLRRLVEDNKRLRQFGCEHCDCTCNSCAPCGVKEP